MTRTIALILSATLGAACASRGEVEYATTSSPELVEIENGVMVTVDASEPLFYTNNAYWLHRDHGWYRAETAEGRWIRIATPPTALTAIADPGSYANYPRDRTARAMPPPAEPQRVPEEAVPYPNPRPPHQEPPMLPDDPGTVDRVPSAPTTPMEPGEVTHPPIDH